MIIFKKPELTIEKDKAVVTCEVLIDNKKKEIFYEIDKKYKDYLCLDRSDAFIISAIHYAMKHHHDITCDIPLTSSIYHNLTTYLIPTLAKHSDNLSEIRLNVPVTEEPVKTKGATGTGISCGVDSMHVLKNYLNPECKDMKLDYLCLNNVGSFKAYAKKYEGIGANQARNFLIEKATKVAKEVNLPLIITNSNIHKIFNDLYFRVHTYSNMFSVFMLQKLFSKYFYASSGWDLGHFDVCDTKTLDSAEYELLIFNVLNTSTLKIYSEGSEKTRLEKTIDIADYDIARKNLHVCIKDGVNCGTCLKCRRTILALDSINKLNNFKDVFDVEYYKNNKEEYKAWLLKEAKNPNSMNFPTYKLFMQKWGKTPYKDIEEYNKNNIIIKDNDIESIFITKEQNILNKNNIKNYKSNLNYRLNACIEIAKLSNKNINIYKKLLNKIEFSKVLNKETTEIKLYDLIYFILYKPKAGMRIIKFLTTKKYINLSNLNKNTTSTNKLNKTFKEFIKYDILVNALEIDNVTVNNKQITNKNSFNKCKDIYYKNNEYKTTFFEIRNGKYYFIGLSNDYIISMISKHDNKDTIYNNGMICYGLIKDLIKCDRNKNN